MLKMEKTLYQWILHKNSKNSPITSISIRDKAKDLHAFFKRKCGKDDNKSFKASWGWFTTFDRRFNVKQFVDIYTNEPINQEFHVTDDSEDISNEDLEKLVQDAEPPEDAQG